MLSKEENPWNRLTVEEYLAHMAHPSVGQVEKLSQMMRSQFLLLSPKERRESTVAILGITQGNGLNSARELGLGHIIGIDINEVFLETCGREYADLGDRLELCRVDLISERFRAAKLCGDAALILADLLIEHIHLENMILLLQELPKRRRIFSCVLQQNPDGSAASVSGHEQAFADILPHIERADPEETIRAMEGIGYRFIGGEKDSLVNGKEFLRLDFMTP